MPSVRRSLGVVGITLGVRNRCMVRILLLRRRLRKRIGAGESKTAYMTKLWIAALAAGVVSVLLHLYIARDLHRHPVPRQ